jgi:signal transduction histidine kinase
MTRGAPAASEGSIRRLLIRAVALYSALVLANALLVTWLVVHDYGHRALSARLYEVNATGIELAQTFTRELAPLGAIDHVLLEQRRSEIAARLERTLAELPILNALHIVRRDGLVLLEIRRLAGADTIVVSESTFGGAAPAAPDSPPAGMISIAATESRGGLVPEGRGIELPLGAAGDRLVLGVSPDAIDAEIANLEQDLYLRLAVGGAISALLLIVAFLYVLRLIHRTRRLEADAQQARHLAYMGTLASGLAHEIRNPLNAMNINLEMLEEEIASGDVGEDSLVLLRSSRSEVQRLDRLVKDFLAYARPRAAKIEELAATDLVGDVVRFVRSLFDAAGVGLEIEHGRGVPPILVDKEQVQQALLNVLQNAFDVSEKGSKVTVRVGATRHGEASIEIEDRGPGIAPEDRARIFEIFWSKKPAGSGLGLPIAQRVVEAHGGRIDVEAGSESGSVFRIVLPPSMSRPAVDENALAGTQPGSQGAGA